MIIRILSVFLSKVLIKSLELIKLVENFNFVSGEYNSIRNKREIFLIIFKQKFT